LSTDISYPLEQMSFCETCDGICKLPKPSLVRQVGGSEAILDGCDYEPCASCIDRWEHNLECLKNLDDIDGLTAYHIANHEMRIHLFQAEKRRIAREKALQALLKARKTYLDAYDPVVEAECFKRFQLACRAREAAEFPMETYERQTNEHPMNYQAPQPQCLVKNCTCLETGIAHLVKKVDGEFVAM